MEQNSSIGLMMRRFDRSKATDTQLLMRFEQQGDQSAFAELVRRHGPMVLSTTRRIVGSQEDSEEAFQATFFALAKAVDRLRKKSAVAGWLHRAAHSCATQIQRGNARWQQKNERMEERLNNEVNASDGNDPSSIVANEEVGHILDEELARLPTKLHVAIVLCELEGLSQQQAAKQLGIAPSTVNDRVTRGRRQLRDRLVRRGVSLTLAGLATCVPSSSETSAAMSPEFITETTSKAALYVAEKSVAEVGVTPAVIQAANMVIWAMTKSRIITVLWAALGIVVLMGSGVVALMGSISGTAATQLNTTMVGTLIYDFIQDDTNDVLATIEFSKLPATHSDVIRLTFTAAGNEIFGFGPKFDDAFGFTAGALVSDGSTGLVSTNPAGGGFTAIIRNDESSIHDANALLIGTSTAGGPADSIGLSRSQPGAFFVIGRFEVVPER